METFSPRPFLQGGPKAVVPWERAPILALLTLAALLVPMTTGKAFYCHQLCPHGAAQQWMRKFKKKPVRLPRNWIVFSNIYPVGLLALVVVFAFTASAHMAAILEPFDAYVWEVAGGITIAIALLSLLASAFVPWPTAATDAQQGPCLNSLNLEKTIRDGAEEIT